MQITPQADGGLLLDHPTPETVFDMGNARIYAQCDAQGRITRACLPDGSPLQTMRTVRFHVLNTDPTIDTSTPEATAQSLARQYKGTRSEGSAAGNQTMWVAHATQLVTFDTAKALARLWTLSGTCAGLVVTCTTYVDRSSPAVFQRVQLVNNAAETRIFELDVTIGLQFAEGYAGAGTASPGRIHTKMNVEATFSATLRPWQIVMGKVQTEARYALAVAPGQSQEFCLITGVGDETAVDRLLANWRDTLADAEAFAKQLGELASSDDPLLQSLIVSGLNAGLSSYKELDSGVGGFLAGVSYAYPPRAYFRDGYWTAQAALIVEPKMARAHLLWLARGIGIDGSCPSGVWDPGLFADVELDTPDVLNWLNHHYDSPSFFVMLLHDYISASGDAALLNVKVGSRSIWEHAVACLDFLSGRDQDGDGLFEKPYAANDWADNVFRSSLVTYDLALFYRALICAAALAKRRGETEVAQKYEAQAERVKAAINLHLWDEERGHYQNYRRDGFVETHLSIDSLLTVLYGIADEKRAARSLDAARRVLQTRHNSEQAYGDWGVMCCYPFYREPGDLFDISAEPYHYHNGADWPYWDGIYGLILLYRNDPDWRYVLTRWWEVSLEKGWLTPVEYFSPPYPQGGLLQGWSAMPAVALLHKTFAHWLYQKSRIEEAHDK